MNQLKYLIAAILLAGFLSAGAVFGQEKDEKAEKDQKSKTEGSGAMDLAKAAQKSNNPVSDAWLLITQNDLTLLKGDLTDDYEVQERLSFQPVMPVPIFGGDWNLVNRVVVSAVSSPFNENVRHPDPLEGRSQGIGDTVFFSMFAPNRNDGVIWGVGPTFILPTASKDSLGQEKWQAGVAVLYARLGNSFGGGLGDLESWNVGFLGQYWTDIGGTDRRADTSQADIQYFINYKLNATS